MKQAAAKQAAQPDRSFVDETQRTLVDQFAAVRQRLADQASEGLPEWLTAADPVARPLLTTLGQINERMRQYNNNQDPITIPGRGERLDETRLVELQRQADLALALAGAAESGSAIAGALPSETSTETRPRTVGDMGTPQPVIPSTRPPIEFVTDYETPAPAEQPAAPAEAPVQTPQEQYQHVLDELQAMIDAARGTEDVPGPTRQEQRQARSLRDELSRELRRESPRASKLEEISGRAETLLRTANDRIEDERLARAPADARISVSEAQSDPLQGQLSALLDSLQAIGTQTARDVSARLPDVWLLGQDQRQRMFGLLQEAATALQSNDESLARQKLGEAVALFEGEQALYRQLVVMARDHAGESSRMVQESGIPSSDELSAAEQRLGLERGTLYLTTGRGVHNGREDLASVMSRRQDEAAAYLAENDGALSFTYVSDLYRAVRSDEVVIKLLIDLWGYAMAHDSQSAMSDTTFLRNYAVAAMTLMDPNYNPYNEYPEEVRQALLRQHARDIPEAGITAEALSSDARFREVEQNLVSFLMHSKIYRYNDVLYQFYAETLKFAPRLDASAVQELAELRVARTIYEDVQAYRPYLSGTLMRGNSGVLLDPQSQERLDLARSYVEDALRVSGLADDDPIKIMAQRQLDAATDVAPQDIPAAADRLYHVAVSLVAIREAELWRQTAVLQPSSGVDLAAADDAIALARKVFEWNFSDTSVDALYYPNLARNLADSAIVALAPPVFVATDSTARFAQRTQYGMALSEMDRVLVPIAETDVAVTLGSSEEAGIRAAAIDAELRYLGLLSNLRDEAGFALPPVLAVDEGWEVASAVLSPNIGRSGFLNAEVPRERGTLGRIDQHFVPSDNEIAELSDVAHEDVGRYQWGSLYVEVERQRILNGDSSAPPVLRMLSPAAFDAGMDTASAAYGASGTTPEAQLQASNQQLLNILDARIEYLSQLLGRPRYDGVLLSDLAEYYWTDQRDPAQRDSRAYPIVRAQEALEEATRLRDVYAAALDRDLSTGVNPRQAIAIAESGLVSLMGYDSPDSVLQEATCTQPWCSLPAPPVQIPEYAVTVSYDPDPRRNPDTGQRYWLAEAHVTPAPGPDVTLLYYWTFYEPTQDGTLLLRNSSAAVARGEPEYVGMVVPDVTLPDGSVGAAVVRIRPTEAVTRRGADVEVMGATEDGVTEIDVGGRPAEVLFYLKDTRTLDAVRDELFTRRSREGLLDFSDQPVHPVPYRVGRPEARAFVEPLER